MRKIKADEITKIVKNLCMETNYYLPEDILDHLKKGLEKETSPLGKKTIEIMLKNAEIAAREKIPLCQDTGIVVVFVEVGQEVVIVNGDLEKAINEGVRQGYIEGYLRKSVVSDPLFERKNTNNNTPPVIYTRIVSGNRLKITLLPKGAGSENMSKIAMLKPSDGIKGVKEFIIQTVKEAGPNPCPPVIVGVGIGGSFEKCAFLAKKALLRKIGEHNTDGKYARLERELIKEINNLGIGPQGFGGKITALAVNIEYFPCHIASLPVAVNLQCWVSRHKQIEI
ncbi:fumarate hydratase [Candidatus Aerophobetes bacterium]|uniref:Fumarate hydratase n=1 Tax=Aerophobetes bacterium TaxID=2030807 RepID=A0A662DKD6_UNCAE|nr:MAG: fumarate hydratase [Candidatus Aerophobetes bacterium]